MERRMTRTTSRTSRLRWVGALGLSSVALAFNACHSEDGTLVFGAPSEGTSTLQGESLGSLLLPLVTSDTVKYRLRSALFDVERSGAVVASLDSESDPDAEQLSVSLNPGSYQLRLADGWTLERLEADGGADPVRAALISPNPATFAVRNDLVTRVAFTFTTSAGTVTFGEGAVSVRLGVSDPASLGSCDIVNQSGCDSGQHCLFADDAGQTFCATPGSLEVGSPCVSEQCVFGAQCLSLDPAAPEASTCTQLCNPAFPPFGCDCRGLSVGDNIGVCGPPPPNSCDLLDPESCPDGQACQYPGGSFGVCGTPGTLPQGSSCFGEECAAGLDCYGDDPQFGFTGTCYRFCDVQNPDCDFCFDVGTGSVGRCFF
jgi:hypothetical protein